VATGAGEGARGWVGGRVEGGVEGDCGVFSKMPNE